MNLLVEYLSWVGVVLILGAYILLNIDVLQIESTPYHLMNLVGALLVGIDAYLSRNYQPVVINIVWGLVAFWALSSIVFSLA